MHRFLFMPSFILTGTYSKLYSNVGRQERYSTSGETLGIWIWDGWAIFSSEPFKVPSAITASFALSCKLVYPPTGMANRITGQQDSRTSQSHVQERRVAGGNYGL
jgi:hypothetical protein